MRRLILCFLPLVALLAFAFGGGGVARGTEPVIPADHQEFFSGGAIEPDLTATGTPTSPTGTGAPPRVGANTQVNAPQQGFPNGLFGRSETTIAASDDGQLLVVGFNDAQGFCGSPFGVACTPQSPPGLSGFAFSSDGGLTWTDGGAPPVIAHVFTRGDPWLDRGGFDGVTVYYANLSVHDQTGADLGVAVHRGHFSAGLFAWEDVHVFGPSNAGDFFDKEAIAAAKDGSGAAYVSLTNFIKTCNTPANGFGQIEVFRTHDGGDTWHGPTIVSPDQTFVTDPSNPACGTTGVLQQSSAPAIGPNGEVYVAWQFGPTFSPGLSTNAEIRVARSLNGGVSFDTPVAIAAINSMRRDPPLGFNRSRINDHPRIAVATTGPNKGRVYVVFYSAVAPTATASTVQNTTSVQIFASFSDDQGQTWSTPAPLGGPVLPTTVKRWWPTVSVEPGGVVNVVYYEEHEQQVTPNPTDIECNVSIGGGLRRKGTLSSLVDTFWVRSLDGGQTWEAPIRVTTATTNWCTVVSNVRPNMGDYIGSTSGGNRVLATWADGRNGVPDTFFAAGLGAGKSR